MPIIVHHGEASTVGELAQKAGEAARNRYLTERRGRELDRKMAFDEARLARQDDAIQSVLERRHAERGLRMSTEARLREAEVRESNATARQAIMAQERTYLHLLKERAQQGEKEQDQQEDRDRTRDMLSLWDQRFQNKNDPAALQALAEIRGGKVPDFAVETNQGDQPEIELPGVLGKEIGAAIAGGDISSLRGRLSTAVRDDQERVIPGAMSREASMARAAIAQVFRQPNISAAFVDDLEKDIRKLPTEDRALVQPIFEEHAAAFRKTQAEVVAPTVVEMLPDLIDNAHQRFRREARGRGVDLADMSEADRIAIDAQVIEQVMETTGLTPDQLDDVLTALEQQQRLRLQEDRRRVQQELEVRLLEEANPEQDPGGQPAQGGQGGRGGQGDGRPTRRQ